MRLLKNAGADRVIDLLEPALQPGGQLDVVTRSSRCSPSRRCNPGWPASSTARSSSPPR
jgi:hypothetical protein